MILEPWNQEDKDECANFLLRVAADLDKYGQVVVLTFSEKGNYECRRFERGPFGAVTASGLARFYAEFQMRVALDRAIDEDGTGTHPLDFENPDNKD